MSSRILCARVGWFPVFFSPGARAVDAINALHLQLPHSIGVQCQLYTFHVQRGRDEYQSEAQPPTNLNDPQQPGYRLVYDNSLAGSDRRVLGRPHGSHERLWPLHDPSGRLDELVSDDYRLGTTRARGQIQNLHVTDYTSSTINQASVPLTSAPLTSRPMKRRCTVIWPWTSNTTFFSGGSTLRRSLKIFPNTIALLRRTACPAISAVRETVPPFQTTCNRPSTSI